MPAADFPYFVTRAMDDDEEIDRLLAELGLELPDVADDAAHDADPPPLDDPDELGDWQW